MGLVDDNRKLFVLLAFQLVDDIGEFLQRRHDNIATSPQSSKQLVGAVFDPFHHAFAAVKRSNLIAQLTVYHVAVADHNDRIDFRDIHQPLGDPGDGFGFAAAGAVPHQVPPANALAADIRFHFQHGVQLVITGENHRAAVIDEHEFTEDLQ